MYYIEYYVVQLCKILNLSICNPDKYLTIFLTIIPIHRHSLPRICERTRMERRKNKSHKYGPNGEKLL